MNKQRLLLGGLTGALVAASYNKETPVLTERQERQLALRKSAELQIAAYDRLMNGPKATRPSWRAVRKTILRIKNGLPVTGPWRSWRAVADNKE